MSQGTNKERIVANNAELATIRTKANTLPDYLDTSDADATASDITLNKTAYVNGTKITGTSTKIDTTIDDKVSAISYNTSGANPFVLNNLTKYYEYNGSGEGILTINITLLEASTINLSYKGSKLNQGESITEIYLDDTFLDTLSDATDYTNFPIQISSSGNHTIEIVVTGTNTTMEAKLMAELPISSNTVVDGYTGFVNGQKVLGTYTGSTINNQDKTVTPTTSQQVISADSGYTGLGNVTVSAVDNTIDSNITAGNIKKDVSILGVTGTLESGAGEDMGLIFTTEYQVDLLDSNEKYVDVLVPKSFDVTDMVYGANIYNRWNAGDTWMMNMNSGIQRIEFHEGNEYNYYRIVYSIGTTSPIYTKMQVVFAKTGYQTAISNIFINPLPYTYVALTLLISPQNGNNFGTDVVSNSNLSITDENDEPFTNFELMPGSYPAQYKCRLPVGTYNISFNYNNTQLGTYTRTITQEEVNNGSNYSDTLSLNANAYTIGCTGYVQDSSGTQYSEIAPLNWNVTLYDANDTVVLQKTYQEFSTLSTLAFGDITHATIEVSHRNCVTQTLTISDLDSNPTYSNSIYLQVAQDKAIVRYSFADNYGNTIIFDDTNSGFSLINSSTGTDVYSSSHKWYNGSLYLYIEPNIDYTLNLLSGYGYEEFSTSLSFSNGGIYTSFSANLQTATPKATVVFNVYNLENERITSADYINKLQNVLTISGNGEIDSSGEYITIKTTTTTTDNSLDLNVNAPNLLSIPYSVTSTNIENYETVQRDITIPFSSLYVLFCLDLFYYANRDLNFNSNVIDLVPSVNITIATPEEPEVTLTAQTQRLHNINYIVCNHQITKNCSIFAYITPNSATINGVTYNIGTNTISANIENNYSYINVAANSAIYLTDTTWLDSVMILNEEGSPSRRTICFQNRSI